MVLHKLQSALRWKLLGLAQNVSINLSELTGQPIPIVMRISFLIKTNHPDLSNPKYYAQRGWMVFQQNLLEKAYFIAKMSGLTIVQPASPDFWKAPL